MLPGKRLFVLRKNKPFEWGFPGNYQTGQIVTVLWDWCFWGAPRLLGCQTTIFHSNHGCETAAGFQVITELRRAWWEQGKFKHHKICCFDPDSGFKKKINPLWILVHLWLISRTLKKLIWTIHVNVLLAFMTEQPLGGPYSIILTDVILLSPCNKIFLI